VTPARNAVTMTPNTSDTASRLQPRLLRARPARDVRRADLIHSRLLPMPRLTRPTRQDNRILPLHDSRVARRLVRRKCLYCREETKKGWCSLRRPQTRTAGSRRGGPLSRPRASWRALGREDRSARGVDLLGRDAEWPAAASGVGAEQYGLTRALPTPPTHPRTMRAASGQVGAQGSSPHPSVLPSKGRAIRRPLGRAAIRQISLLCPWQTHVCTSAS
jgi:hypothetical protein